MLFKDLKDKEKFIFVRYIKDELTSLYVKVSGKDYTNIHTGQMTRLSHPSNTEGNLTTDEPVVRILS